MGKMLWMDHVRQRQGEGVETWHNRSPLEAVSLCAMHVRQLGGGSPLSNLMEVKD